MMDTWMSAPKKAPEPSTAPIEPVESDSAYYPYDEPDFD